MSLAEVDFLNITNNNLEGKSIVFHLSGANVQYKKTIGGSWLTAADGTSAVIDPSETIYLQGTNTSLSANVQLSIADGDNTGSWRIAGCASSLIDSGSADVVDTCPQGFFQSFLNNKSVGEILDITDLRLNIKNPNTSAFSRMFKNCTSLKEIPAGLFQSVETMENNCCYEMFCGCSAITTLPAHLIPSLAEVEVSCFGYMFAECTSLEKIKSEKDFLPSLTVANNAYLCMFLNCSSLKKAPYLMAKTPGQRAYREMFKGCSSLREVHIGLESWGDIYFEDNVTGYWLEGVSNVGAVYSVSRSLTRMDGTSRVPTTWEFYGPVDPAVMQILGKYHVSLNSSI